LIDQVLHEGRQPTTSIKNQAQLGINDLQKAPDIAQARFSGINRFQSIDKSADVLGTVFRRIEPFGGRKRGRPKQLNIESIIKNAFDALEGEVKRLNVSIELPASQTLVSVDESEIQEVVINLLRNSLYWLEQVDEASRKITVSLDRKGPEQLEILFSDSGPGIPEHIRHLIFEPYFSAKPNGVGLGLSISGEIVQDFYGGSLELIDKGPQKGAHFRITLRKRV
jgi:hypothetical protein